MAKAVVEKTAVCGFECSAPALVTVKVQRSNIAQHTQGVMMFFQDALM